MATSLGQRGEGQAVKSQGYCSWEQREEQEQKTLWLIEENSSCRRERESSELEQPGMSWGSPEVSMHQRCLLTGSLMPHLPEEGEIGKWLSCQTEVCSTGSWGIVDVSASNPSVFPPRIQPLLKIKHRQHYFISLTRVHRTPFSFPESKPRPR